MYQNTVCWVKIATLKAHPGLSVSLCLSDYKCTPATQAIQNLPSKTVGFFHTMSTGLEWGEKNRESGGFQREQGFMTSSSICIIVCISCSASTQCQHGWSGLISKLHHKDKRNTCRYKAILLPTDHVKLLRRARGLLQIREWADCCITIS